MACSLRYVQADHGAAECNLRELYGFTEEEIKVVEESVK